MRSMCSPAPSRTSGSGAFGARSSMEDLLFNVELSLDTGSVRRKTDQAHQGGTQTSSVTFQSQLVRGPGTGRKSAFAVQATGPTIKADVSTYTPAYSFGAGTRRSTSGLTHDKHFPKTFHHTAGLDILPTLYFQKSFHLCRRQKPKTF